MQARFDGSALHLAILAVASVAFAACTEPTGGPRWRPNAADGDGTIDGRAHEIGVADAAGDVPEAGAGLVCGRPGLRIFYWRNAAKLPADCEIYRGSFIFWYAQEVEFSEFPPLRVIEGRFEVSGSIETLEGLEELESVGGGLQLGKYGPGAVVGSSGLQNLGDLGRLERIGGPFEIIGHRDLVDLRGVERLRSVGGIEISQNEVLESLRSLDGLETIRGDVRFDRNEKLTEAQVLEFLEGIEVRGEIEVNE